MERFKVEEDAMSQTPFYDAQERYDEDDVKGGVKEMVDEGFYGNAGGFGEFGGQGYGMGMMRGYEVPVRMEPEEGELNPYSFEYQGLVGENEERPVLVE